MICPVVVTHGMMMKRRKGGHHGNEKVRTGTKIRNVSTVYS